MFIFLKACVCDLFHGLVVKAKNKHHLGLIRNSTLMLLKSKNKRTKSTTPNLQKTQEPRFAFHNGLKKPYKQNPN